MADQANLDYARHATDLALAHLKDELKKDHPDPELLKRLGWTRKDLENFVKRWEQMRKQAQTPGEQGTAAQQELDETLRSLGLRPRATSQRGSTQRGDNARGYEGIAPQQSAAGIRRAVQGLHARHRARRKIAVRRGRQRGGPHATMETRGAIQLRPRRLLFPGPWSRMLDRIPRYLVPFHPKRVPHHFADVLIIGGGLAGLRAALAVPAAQSVLVITKSSLRQSNSTYAQGGIAGVHRSGGPLRRPHRRHARRRRRSVRSGGRRDGRPRSAGADQRADRVGHELRSGVGRPGTWAAKAATAIIASCTRWATRPARK